MMMMSISKLLTRSRMVVCVCVWVAVMAVLRAESRKTLLAVCDRGIRR